MSMKHHKSTQLYVTLWHSKSGAWPGSATKKEKERAAVAKSTFFK